MPEYELYVALSERMSLKHENENMAPMDRARENVDSGRWCHDWTSQQYIASGWISPDVAKIHTLECLTKGIF